MNSQSRNSCSSAGSERHVEPGWLRAQDVEPLTDRFAQLDAAEVRQVALAIEQGSPPADVLLVRLVNAGLSPEAARQLIVELRLLRERHGMERTPIGAAPGSEFLAALNAAAASYLHHPGNDELAAEAIVAQVGWSLQRARWFISVNQDRISQATQQLAGEPPAQD